MFDMKPVIPGLAVLLAHSCLAQLPGPTPAFDVASVRPSSHAGNGDEVHVETSPGTFTTRGASLRFYIEWAYHTPPFQMDGPAWLSHVGFDIVSKAATPANDDQLRLMMRSLLAGRFGVKVHTAPREMEVYALTLAKGGPKFHESATEGSPLFGNDGKAAMTAKHVSMSDFAAKLSEPLGRPVVDATGLKGRYDIRIDVTSYMTAAMDKGGELETMNLLLTAFQKQLGLKFISRKSTVDILVVDHAEKVPAEN
jgi:uncharacterized protein (TIGR03435 family)